MDRLYSASDLHKELVKRLTDAKGTIQAWQAVERLHKKDGGDFANIRKNFSGLYLEDDYNYASHKETYTASVHLFCGAYMGPGHYANDTIYQAGASADEIDQAIKDRIKQLQERVASLEREVEQAGIAWSKYLAAMQDLRSALEQMGLKQSDTWYCITEAMHNTYL